MGSQESEKSQTTQLVPSKGKCLVPRLSVTVIYRGKVEEQEVPPCPLDWMMYRKEIQSHLLKEALKKAASNCLRISKLDPGRVSPCTVSQKDWRKTHRGLPQWSSGWESAFWCRVHQVDPWWGNWDLTCLGAPSLCSATTEPAHCIEKSGWGNEDWIQPKKKKNQKNFRKFNEAWFPSQTNYHTIS